MKSKAALEMNKERKTLWQFMMFTLLSVLTTVVDFGTFALFNFWVFSHLKVVDFNWFVFDYSQVNGGLCAFLAFALSFVISQTFNFVIQRKVTFSANNNVWFSAFMYLIMVMVVFFLQLWIPTFIRPTFVRWFGENWGDVVLKNLNMTLSFVIQFPINKWVIMRKSHPKQKAKDSFAESECLEK